MKNENIPEEKDARKGFSDESGLVRFTAPPESVEMDKTYSDFINSLVQDVHKTRISVVLASNSAMITLYWNIGNEILKKQKELGWGAKVIDRIAFDLKKAFPEMKGFSPRNIKYMRKFAETWVDKEIMQQVVAQIPWRSNLILLEKLNDQEKRIWYAKMTLKNGWSSNILQLQIESKAKERMGKALSNFKLTLPDKESDLVNNIFKDPYLFDFLGTDVPRREVEVEKKLTEHIQEFLLELGKGFAFVERQKLVRTDVDDFYIDLVFYNYILKCFVLIDLKNGRLTHKDVGQMDFYVRLFDDLYKKDDDNPTIGLLLCSETDKAVAKYSVLNDSKQIFASKYLTLLPTEQELAAEIERQRDIFIESHKSDCSGDKNE